MTAGRPRRWLGVLCWLLLGYAIVGVPAGWEASRELVQGQAALGARDPERAIRHLGRALRWYLPGLPANGQAAELLWAVGQQAEAEGRPEQALAAYRELRGGVLGIRTLWQPHARWLEPTSTHIARLMAAQGTRDRHGEPASFAVREQEHLLLLRQPLAPDPWLSLGVVLGFFGWVAALAAGITWGLDERLRPRWPTAGIAGVLAALCFVAWLVCLRLA